MRSVRGCSPSGLPFLVVMSLAATLHGQGIVAPAALTAPTPDSLKAAAALCSAHPGPTPLYIEWSDGNGEAVRLRSRRVRVAAEEDLVRALRDLLGTDSVHYVKAG